MKNQLTNRMPEDSCSCEVAGGPLWTGEIFGLFVFKGGDDLEQDGADDSI
jgi:hypothetical protein